MKKRAYRSVAREQMANDTREGILRALDHLIVRDNTLDVTFAAVAKTAKVTEMTVYRHFACKDDLLKAYWVWASERFGLKRLPQLPQEAIDQAPGLYAGYDRHPGLARAGLLTAQGREMRQSVNDERMAAFLAIVANGAPELSDRDQQGVAALIQLLFSSQAWMSMQDHWNLGAPDSGTIAAWAIRVLLAAARSDPPELDSQQTTS